MWRIQYGERERDEEEQLLPAVVRQTVADMETERGGGRPTSALARIRRDSSLEVGSSQSQARSRLALNLSLSPRRSVSAGQREAEKDLRPVKVQHFSFTSST